MFSIAILVVMGVFASVARSNAQSRQYAMAQQLARDVLEAEIHKPYANILDVPLRKVPLSFENHGNLNVIEFSAEFKVFLPEVVAGSCKHVAAVVTWKEGDTAREVSLDTYVSRLFL